MARKESTLGHDMYNGGIVGPLQIHWPSHRNWLREIGVSSAGSLDENSTRDIDAKQKITARAMFAGFCIFYGHLQGSKSSRAALYGYGTGSAGTVDRFYRELEKSLSH